MVAHIVAAEVFAELERVVATSPGEVVDELVLRDVTPLREGMCGGGVRAGEVVLTRILVEDLCIVERSRSLRCRGTALRSGSALP